MGDRGVVARQGIHQIQHRHTAGPDALPGYQLGDAEDESLEVVEPEVAAHRDALWRLDLLGDHAHVGPVELLPHPVERDGGAVADVELHEPGHFEQRPRRPCEHEVVEQDLVAAAGQVAQPGHDLGVGLDRLEHLKADAAGREREHLLAQQEAA